MYACFTLQAADLLLSFGTSPSELSTTLPVSPPVSQLASPSELQTASAVSLPVSLAVSPLVSLANNKGSTPLHFLCYAESESGQSLLLADALLAAGSDVNAKDSRGVTPFLVCCTKGRYWHDAFYFSSSSHTTAS